MTIDKAYEIMQSRGPESLKWKKREVEEAAAIVANVQNAALDLLRALEGLLLLEDYRSEGRIVSKSQSHLVRMDELFPERFKQAKSAIAKATGAPKLPPLGH